MWRITGKYGRPKNDLDIVDTSTQIVNVACGHKKVSNIHSNVILDRLKHIGTNPRTEKTLGTDVSEVSDHQNPIIPLKKLLQPLYFLFVV